MSFYLKAAVFIIASVFCVRFSHRSILNIRSYGFYRLFAWESIIVLILINLDRWFDDWLSLQQIVSWALLGLSAYLVAYGTLELLRLGKPSAARNDSTLAEIEKTTKLVTSGPYRYIRHPIYSSAVVGVWGIVLKDVSPASIFLALISIAFLTATAKLEEAQNIRYFGTEYRDYMKRTRMFIPYIL